MSGPLVLRPYQERFCAWSNISILLKNSGREGATNTDPALNIKPVVEARMSDRPDTGNPSATQEIISRAEAKARGLIRYFTGKPCHRGHISERQVSSFVCLVCKNEKRKEFARQNPEAVSRANKKYYYANHERMLARAATYAKANPEKNRANARAQYHKNPTKFAVYSRNRKARVRAAEGRHTAADITAIRTAQKGRCAYCRASLRDGEHVDHIIALANGGSNWPSNLQLLCPPCNLKKHAKDPIDFAQEMGLLL